MKLFPVPATEFLNIEFNNSSELPSCVIKIFDLNGKQVMIESRSILRDKNEIKIDVKSLSSGTYFVNLSLEEKTANKKFVILR